jgi:hypothetical protein
METDLQVENAQLREELQQRDVLIQQLSEELFRLVKGNVAFLPSSSAIGVRQYEESLQILTEKITILEAQLLEARCEAQNKERIIVSLRRQIHELSDRQKILEKTLADQPSIYRAKFAERMIPVKRKIELLQKENRNCTWNCKASVSALLLAISAVPTNYRPFPVLRWRVVTNSTARAIAERRLADRATPCPAMSNAVP